MKPHGRETRHTFRLPLARWNDSLALRFDLSFAPGARGPSRFASGPFMDGVTARRVRWDCEGADAVAVTPRGGAIVEHLRAAAARWREWLEVRGASLLEADEVRCRACRAWTASGPVLCLKCGRPV